MVNKKLFIVCIVSFFMLGGTLMAAGQWVEWIDEEDSLCFPVGMLSLGAPDGVEQERASVAFPHSRHMTYSCDTCHHKWQHHAVLDTCTTSGCHDLIEAPDNAIEDGKYTAQGIRYYKYAYHKMCRDCHRDINAENRKKARDTNINNTMGSIQNLPMGCIECHPED